MKSQAIQSLRDFFEVYPKQERRTAKKFRLRSDARPRASLIFRSRGRLQEQGKIYNVLGQLVRTLADKFQGTSFYSVQWDGRDEKGKRVASGIYFCRMEVGNFKKVRKWC